MQRRFCYILFLLIMLTASAGWAQEVPPAGTSIDNQASGRYDGPANGDTMEVISNMVSTVVQAAANIQLVPNQQRQSRVGERETFIHRLTNRGNVDVAVTITAENASDNPFFLDALSFAPKAKAKKKGSAAAQAETSAVSDNLKVILSPGEEFQFEVTMRVNEAAQPGEKAKALIKAEIEDGGILLENINVITVLEGPVMGVEKTQSEGAPSRGGRWTYNLTASNSGDQTAEAVPVTIDDESHRKVLVHDRIPVNTTFASVDDAAGGTPLYHVIGSETNEYRSNRPEELSTIDQFAVAFDSLAPGQQKQVQFTITINDNASGSVLNTARVYWRDPIDNVQQVTEIESNEVLAQLLDYDPDLNYFIDDSYTDVSSSSALGQPLLLQADAAGCNVNFAAEDTTEFILTSDKTEDEERFTAVETGPNTGFFRVSPNIPTRSADENEVVSGNGIFETLPNDIVTAVARQCNDQSEELKTQILISPFGVVFNSQNGEPVAGAVVELIDVSGEGNGGNPGGHAFVYDENGNEQLANTQTTAEKGVFRFPHVKPSTYRIEVTTPAGYVYVSEVAPVDLPEGRTANPQGSYGEEFSVSGNPAPVAFDIPLDPDSNGVLFAEKTSSVTAAAIGDFVTYEITVTNNSAETVTGVRVEDTLPFGFRYEEGTARLNGITINDPEGGKGPSLSFKVGEIEANQSASLNYRVLLGAGARPGEATNTAVAISDEAVTKSSNEAHYSIDVRGGVFTDKGYIVGKVFADHNENDVQDPGEPGVPGIRLYLENGSFVITDSEGKYTFYGIDPNKHIVKLDNYTLPQGSRLREVDNRHAGDPSSRFVDLKKGQLHRADFAICDLTPAAREEISTRHEQLKAAAGQALDASVNRDMRVEDNRSNQVVKRQKASGILEGAKLTNIKNQGAGNLAARPDTAVEMAGSTDAQQPILEEMMVYEEPELGFIGLVSGDTLRWAQTNIWVKGTQGSKLVLKANGEVVSESKISKKAVLEEKQLQAHEYIGIALKPGRNSIAITENDPFGNTRGTEELVLYAPGNVETLQLTIPKNEVPADGTTAAVVRVQLKDKQGITVKSKIPVTLDVSAGEWLVKDADPNTPGTQTFIENGQADFELRSTIEPQDASVRVSMGVMEETTTVSFLPDLRPLIAAGIIEGTLRLNGSASIVPARSADGFERELKTLSYTTGDITADARAAFFLKGKIKGNMLLTASFDSEDDDDRLFRDIQPDEFYPVYGESSVKGYDAQTTGRLYVRIDHKRTYALYGDFLTQDRHPAKSLGEYNRTQTGLRLHYEKDWVRLNAFGSQATSLQRIDEFRGQGLSGPYELQSDEILINSEQVELITRDRNQPSVVTERQQLSRFRDYVIEPFSGNIIFKSAVPSVDEELNPVFIRVTYEVEGGAENYLVAGTDGQLKFTDSFEVGGSFVEDRNPENNFRLKSVNTTLRLGENTVLIGEAAETTTELQGTGQGGRVELQHRGEKVNGRLFAGQTDEDFVNRSSRLGQGRTEAGGRGTVELTKSTNLAGEFVYSRNDTLGNKSTGALLNLQQRFSDHLRAEVGVRFARQEGTSLGTNSTDQDVTRKNLRGKLTVDIPKMEGASLFGEYEQDIREAERRLIALGGDYVIKNIGNIYARHEFISSALGAYNLDSGTRRQNTVVGVDASYLKNGKVYSEYRVDDAFNGQNAQAAIGLRNRFQIREGVGINAGLERIFSITGEPLNEGTAISAAIDYTANPLWKGTARTEARFSTNGNIYLNTLGYGRKVNPNWTFLGKNIFNLQTSSREGTPDRIRQRLRLGMAYRQTEQNRWDGLGRYELKYEENGRIGGNYNRLVHIFSTNMNYHPSASWTHSGRIAAKKVAESSADFDSESLTLLLSARTMYDITRRLDAGLNASLMSDAGFDAKDYGIGAEVGYIVQKNLRLAIGFNATGFEDRDLVASNYSRKGVYVGFSYKFDERLFRGLMPDEDRSSELYATCDRCPAEMAQQPKMTVLSIPKPEINYPGLTPVAIKAKPIDYRWIRVVKLAKDIHFATDQSDLSEPSRELLDIIASYLKGRKDYQLEIAGHTDSRASYEYNLDLSRRRAGSVRSYLVSLGLDEASLQQKNLGKKMPEVPDEEDAIDLAMNRRVTLLLDLPGTIVEMVSQYGDLQIDNPAGANRVEWDYVLNADISAVPDRLHIGDEQLNFIQRYLLRRVVKAIETFPQALVIFRTANERQAGLIKTFLESTDADMSRITIEQKNSAGETNRVDVGYRGANLTPVAHRDDILLQKTENLNRTLDKIIELVDRQGDYLKHSKDV